MAVLDVRFDIFLVRFDISRPIRHSVLPPVVIYCPNSLHCLNTELSEYRRHCMSRTK